MTHKVQYSVDPPCSAKKEISEEEAFQKKALAGRAAFPVLGWLMPGAHVGKLCCLQGKAQANTPALSVCLWHFQACFLLSCLVVTWFLQSRNCHYTDAQAQHCEFPVPAGPLHSTGM